MASKQEEPLTTPETLLANLREVLVDNQNALTQLDSLEMMLFSNLRITSEVLFRITRIEERMGIPQALPQVTKPGTTNYKGQVDLLARADRPED